MPPLVMPRRTTPLPVMPRRTTPLPVMPRRMMPPLVMPRRTMQPPGRTMPRPPRNTYQRNQVLASNQTSATPPSMPSNGSAPPPNSVPVSSLPSPLLPPSEQSDNLISCVFTHMNKLLG